MIRCGFSQSINKIDSINLKNDDNLYTNKQCLPTVATLMMCGSDALK